jgi:hypothetical protein
MDSFYVISGVNEAFSVTSKVWRYNAVADSWTQLANIPTGQEGPAATCFDGFIYVAGGGGSNQFFIYDIETDSWSSGPALPRNMWGAAMGAHDGKVYVAGGDNDFVFGGTSNVVNIYDIGTGAWTGTGANMPAAAVTAGQAQAGQHLYVVGGWGDSSPGINVNVTQRYDMADDTWQTGPTFASARADLALSVTRSGLYASGGDANGGASFDATTVVEYLDLDNWPAGVWTATTSLPQALTAMRGGFCTGAFTGGEAWVVGGYTGSAIIGTSRYLSAGQGCFVGELGIAPTGVDFGDVIVGATSIAETVTLSNSGAGELQVTALTAAATPFARSGGSCSASLPITIAAGGSCTLEYTFTPTATGAAAQTLTVTANAPGSGTIGLAGNGVQGELGIAPTGVDFGDVIVGATSIAEMVTLSNSGTGELQVTALTAAATPFARSGGSCSASLPITIAAGGSCTLEYTFTPTATGAAAQTLTVTANAPGSGTIALAGNGVEGSLTIGPETLSFGTQVIGTSSPPGFITLGNDGDASLQVTSLTLASEPFVRTSHGTCGNSLPITIAAGASCTISYRFDPTTIGLLLQVFTVGADAPGATTFTLSGTGGSELIFRNGFEPLD